jgi:recombinational DNA repair protein RecR
MRKLFVLFDVPEDETMLDKSKEFHGKYFTTTTELIDYLHNKKFVVENIRFLSVDELVNEINENGIFSNEFCFAVNIEK